MDQPNIGIMITTKNRRTELERTLCQIQKLDPSPMEVLVCADGCTDDTVRMLVEQFPWVRRFENAVGRGSVASRDFLIRHAASDVLLSLDDDSYPVETNFLAKLRKAIESHPEAAVITFPQASDEYPESLNRTDWGQGKYVHSFANSGAALIRQTYLQLPGYCGFFFHVYEEPDYSLQCYVAGYGVWFEPTLLIRHHFTTSNRNKQRTQGLAVRNEQWSVWMRCPLLFVPAVSLFRLVRHVQYAYSWGWSWVWRQPRWWWSALCGLPKCLRHRRAAPWKSYWAWMRLARSPLATLREFEHAFKCRGG